MFTGLKREICAQAWEVVLPSVVAAAESHLTDKLDGYVVVLDPSSPVGKELFNGHVGAEADEKYLGFARSKAALSARTGMASGRVPQDAPFLFQDGDIKWTGGTNRDGLVVAFSGVQGEYDEMISEWVASAIRAICRDLMNSSGGAMDQDGGYLRN